MNSYISLLVDNWNIFRLYFFSEERIYGRCMFLIIIIMELICVGLDVLFSYWQNAFMNTFQSFDRVAFYRLLLYFCFLLITMTIVSVYKQYLSQLLQLHWRRWLTNHFLEKYLSENVHYKISLLGNSIQTISDKNDNPDQRISMDTNIFIENTCTLILGAFNAGASLIAHIIVLWSLSGVITINITQYWSIRIYGGMVWAALLYATLGTLIINWLGRRLFNLKYAQEHYEANFRYGLVRLRDHTESVALYQSQSNEYASLISFYNELMFNFHKIIRRKLIFNWFDSFYNLAAHALPFLIASPRYFSKEITLGDLMQISSSYGSVHKSSSFISNSYDIIVSWRSAAKRLIEFENTLNEFHRTKQDANVKFIYMPETTSIQIQQLTVQIPMKIDKNIRQIILNDLNLVLEAHQHVLITGKSGCGKSTFLRTVAGIWPYAHGTITLPFDDKIAFVPRKSYCPLGSFRHCLTYPLDCSSSKDDDHHIKHLLCLCQMDHWCNRLDEIQDWSTVLSLGEQQKMAFIRILHPRPKWIFLDEATSSLDEQTGIYLYSILFRQLENYSTIISIGHRENVRQFHQIELAFHNGHVNVISLSNEKNQQFTFF